MTPVKDGRFEIYLDGEKVYDRRDPKEYDFVPIHKVIRKVAFQLKDLFEEKDKVPTG